MSKVFTNNQNYHDIAEAIREKNNTMNLYKPSQMADAIRNIDNFQIKNGEEIHIDPSIIDVELGKGSFYSGFGDFADLNFKEGRVFDEDILDNVLWQKTTQINDELFCCCVAITESIDPNIQPSETDPIIYAAFLLEPDSNKNLVMVQNSIKIFCSGIEAPFNIQFFDNNKIALLWYRIDEHYSSLHYRLNCYNIDVSNKTWGNQINDVLIASIDPTHLPTMSFDSFEMKIIPTYKRIYYTFWNDIRNPNTNTAGLGSWSPDYGKGNVVFGLASMGANSFDIRRINSNNELTSDYGEGLLVMSYSTSNTIDVIAFFITDVSTGSLTSMVTNGLVDLSSSASNFFRPVKLSFLYYPTSNQNDSNVHLIYDIPSFNGYMNTEYPLKSYNLSISNNNLVWTSIESYSYYEYEAIGKRGMCELLDLGKYNNDFNAFILLRSTMIVDTYYASLNSIIFRKKNKGSYPLNEFPSFLFGMAHTSGTYIDNKFKNSIFSTLYNQKNNISCFVVGKSYSRGQDNCIYILGTGNQKLGNNSTRKLFFNNYNYTLTDFNSIYDTGIDNGENPSILLSHNNTDNIKVRKYQNITSLKLNKNKIITIFLGYDPEDLDVDTRSSLYGIISHISDNGETITNGNLFTIANDVSMFKDFMVPHQYPDFSETLTYAVNDIVRYNDEYYRCTTAVSTAGAWTGSANWASYTGATNDNSDEGRKYNAEVLNENSVLVLYQNTSHQPIMKKIVISDLLAQVQTMNFANPANSNPCYLSNFKMLSPNRLLLTFYAYNTSLPELSSIHMSLYQISGNSLSVLHDYNSMNLPLENLYPILDFIPVKSNEFIFVGGYSMDYRTTGGSANTIVYFLPYKLLGDKIVESVDDSGSLGMGAYIQNVDSSINYSFALYDDNGEWHSNIRKKILYTSFIQKSPWYNYESSSSQSIISYFDVTSRYICSNFYNWKNEWGGVGEKRALKKLDSSSPYMVGKTSASSNDISRSSLSDWEGKIFTTGEFNINKNLTNYDYDINITRLSPINEALVFAHQCLAPDVDSDQDIDLCLKILNAYPLSFMEGADYVDGKFSALTKTDYNLENGGDLYFLSEGSTYYPDQVKKRQVVITNTDLSEQYIITVDEGMTWGEWLDSTYKGVQANCFEITDSSDSYLKMYFISLYVNSSDWYIYMGDITDYDGTSFVLNSQIGDSYEATTTLPNQNL